MTTPIPAPHRRTGYLLELAAAGELSPVARQRVLAAARDAAGGEEPESALARDAATILARHPPEQVAAEVARRAQNGGRAPRPWVLALPAAAALAVALAVAIAAPDRPQPAGRTGDGEGAADEVRVKGLAPHLVVHRRTAGGAERVPSGAPVRPGDLVQLGYVAGGRPYGVIVSVDGAGGVTRHWPVDGTMAAGLEPGREVLLPESFRLDDAPRFERFFLVTAKQPFPVAGVLAAARALASRPDALDAALPLPPGLAGADVVLAKELR